MKELILVCAVALMSLPANAQKMSDGQLVTHLRGVYNQWRTATIRKDARKWERLVSTNRLINVRNRIWSERRPFPQTVFSSQLAPPDINRLRALKVRVNGRTAKSVYYGKVDFGVGGKPTDNAFVVSYVQEGSGWKYDGGEFVNLELLPQVRKQVAQGNFQYFDDDSFKPSGVVPEKPWAISGPVKYIAKAYVFCPGREVKVTMNKISEHLFQNTKRAEVVIGGARDGQNTVKYTIKDIPGGDPKAVITVRVYLFSEIPGTKPIKAAEYQVEDGSKPKASGTMSFKLTPEVAQKLRRL